MTSSLFPKIKTLKLHHVLTEGWYPGIPFTEFPKWQSYIYTYTIYIIIHNTNYDNLSTIFLITTTSTS